jgi:PAS domain S-box-containing protein
MAVKTDNKANYLKQQAVLKLWPVAALVVSSFISVSFYREDYYSGLLQGISLIILLVAVYIHSRSKNTWLISNILASLGLTVILPWIITGGAERTGLWFSIPYVCWVFFLNQKKSAIFWLIVYVAAAGVITYLSGKNIVTIAYSKVELLNMLLIYILTFVLLYLFDLVRDSQEQLSKDEIKERKKSEERLQIANEQLFIFFNLNPVATYIASRKDERFRFVNKAFLKLFSLENETAIIGKTAAEIGLIKEKELERLIKQLEENRSHFAGFEYKMQTTDGKTLDILGYNEGIKMDGEDYYIGTMQNISEIKETEEKLRKLSDFQNIMLNGTDYSIVTTDAQTGIILSFNKGAERMTGYTAEEVIGKTSPAIYHDMSDVVARAKQLSEELQVEVKPGIEVFRIKSKLGYESDTHEWTNIRKDKSRITVEMSMSPLRNKDKEIFAYISIAKDITQQKKLQNELIKAKQIAEESVILKEAFLANMSHEIRTPMNAIIGFTDLLLKRNLPSQELDYIQTIKKSGENLLRIINDILDVSKIDSGAMEFEEHPISISEIFSSLSIMLSQKAREKKLQLHFDFDKELPGTVLGDPTRLTQIILNLVGNAIKFTKTGSVEVYAKLLKEDSEHYDIEFSVKDTGIGIAGDKLQFVFERFSQAEAHTTRNYGGTGLGLSIARQLVTLQGGSMSVTSVLGKGSVFTFILPFKKTDKVYVPNQLNYSALDIGQLGKFNILVVEDNLINIKFVKSLFADYKIEADVAENGKLALEKIKQKEYDLVLMDIEMPEMNGYQTTSFIRHDLNNNVPIIAMTAHAMAGEQDKCLALGMDDYISKPINANLLFEKMLLAVSSRLLGTKTEPKKNKVVNLNFLIESIGGKKDVILETIDIFLEQVPQDIQILNEAVSQTDYLRIKNYAHKMKSTASLIGMYEVEPILAEMENLGAEKKEIERIETLNTTLNELCKQGIEEMEQERLNYLNS